MQTNSQQASEVFAQVAQAYHEAARSAGVVEAAYEIAGQSFQLSFAGDALIASIMPALEHLRREQVASPGLRVCLWDTVSTGVSLPNVGWQVLELISHRALSSQTAGRIRTAYNSADKILTLYDLDANLAIYCTYDVKQIPAHFAGSPLGDLFHWWFAQYGLQFLHAGAIGLPDRGVLLIGEGGAGKSTTALASLRSGLFYAADDYCLVDTENPYVYSLYNSGKVKVDNLHRFPHLHSAISNGDRLNEGKALIFLQSACPEKLIAGFPVCAVLMPVVTGLRTTRIVPIPRLEALQPLLVSTMRQLTGTDERDFKAIAGLIRKLPCFRLEVGTDLDGVMRAIEDFLPRL